MPRPNPLILAAATLLALAAAPTLAADVPPTCPSPPCPGGLFELVGPRALGTSAATAGITGSEAVLVNPAATGLRTGYVAEAMVVNERRGALTTGRYLGLVVVDPVSTPVATSVGYFQSLEGDAKGTLFLLGFSGAMSETLRAGVQGRYLKLGGAEPIQAVTADAGLTWDLTGAVTLAVSGFNLVPTHHPDSLPQAMGAGLAVGSDTSVRVQADWRGVFLPHGRTANRYAAGAVGLVGGMLAVRAGWTRDELLGGAWWSGGVGVTSDDGFSIDFGYKQSFQASSARELALSLRYYPPQ